MPQIRKTLLVTGGSNGIGAFVSRLAAERGYDVILTYVRDADAAARVVGDCDKAGAKAHAVRCDVGEESDVTSLFAAVDRIGRLSGLVNNAAVGSPPSPLAEADLANIKRVLDVNLFGTIMVAREAVRRMSTRFGGAGGAIVNISSMAAIAGGAGDQVWYAASKGGVDSFTVGLSREVAGEGIRVNAVAPGPTVTGNVSLLSDPVRLAKMAPTIPMGRLGRPEEVAEAVLWLLSDAASFTTGATLRVSGGR